MTETAQVLCIVNTRKRARQVYESLPEEGRFHLSTLMIPTDREKTLNAIRMRLQNGRTCRVVSTSLVEAGVDVDFRRLARIGGSGQFAAAGAATARADEALRKALCCLRRKANFLLP
ncbi:MAG: hypothetical protein ACLS7Z_06590 [Christensenellales bacterium]